VRLDVATDALLTLQTEVHRDTPTTLAVDIFRRGDSAKGGSRVLLGRNMLGAGGEDTKAFLHGLLAGKDQKVDIVFDLVSMDVVSSQVDSKVSEAKCWPVRIDLTAVPVARAALHWPSVCPSEDRLPKSMGTNVVVLGDRGLEFSGSADPTAHTGVPHFAYRFAEERPWTGFQKPLWSSTLEVPPRLHRFVRFFMRVSFRFASGPLQLAIELFDLKDTPDADADSPKCAMGCLGGVPVHNGQIVDHAMPTGFRYKLWLLAASMSEWREALPDKARHCLDFDFEYSVKFETKLTPFEVGPSAWMCEFARLPRRIVQSPNKLSTEKLSSSGAEYIYGRSIWIRDRFGFPPEEVQDMEHEIMLEVSEACIFRATTHHSDGVDIRLKLTMETAEGQEKRQVCKSIKHPGPVPRQSIFCLLQPGRYSLTFYAQYPLGGLHPCSDFFAQVGLRPVALTDQNKRQSCISQASDMNSLQVQRNLQPATQPQWTSIKVPIDFANKPGIMTVWNQQLSISQQDAAHLLYLRMVLHSDYISSDLRFQVKFEGRHVADNQVTAHGYADMIGPLDAGSYQLMMYYMAGGGSTSPFQLCSNSLVDLRLISKAMYANKTEEWMCTSTRVPLPDTLSPQADEQVLIDSEYMVPSQGRQMITLKVADSRLLRIKATSKDASFAIKVKSLDTNAILSRHQDGIELAIEAGTYLVTLTIRSNGNTPLAACSTFSLNLLLIQHKMLPLCPWAPSSSDQSSSAEAQRSASDHIGNVLTRLVPKKVSKEVDEQAPVTLWMSQGMSKFVDLTVDTMAAVRIDVSVQPPFLPLEVELRRKRQVGKLEAAVATAEWTEHRLLLMYNDLPPGEYQVNFLQPREYMAFSNQAKEDLSELCAHLTISAEVGISSKDAVNSMRSELLDLPDLLAVQPLPSSMNMVGWIAGSTTEAVGTQVYRFSENVHTSDLILEEKAILRVVSEPADLSNADIVVSLEQNGKTLSESDRLGQLVAELDKGKYVLKLQPKAEAPFLVTLAAAYETRLRSDLALLDGSCTELPDLTKGVDFSSNSWTIGPSFLRLGASYRTQQGALMKVPISLTVSSVVYLEVGSALPLDLVRIALQVPEGLWVGEQRGFRNSLEIELPAGKYTIEIGQPKVSRLVDDIKRCLDFSVYVRCMPVNPAMLNSSQGQNPSNELATQDEAAVQTASCFSMGTVALPLDFSNEKGGSESLGGPLDQDGRLLIRSNVLLTDMHDGRKKVFLSVGSQALQLKTAVILGGYSRFSLASQVAFTVTNTRDSSMITQTETWTMEDGWERIYNLNPYTEYWLAWHHTHRERTESACLHFGLMLEVHPVSDLPRMMTCPDNTMNPEEMFPPSLDATSNDVFKYSKPVAFIVQAQLGFLTKTRISLSKDAWVGIEVGFNYFISHAEMDVVSAQDPSTSHPLVLSVMEPANGRKNVMNAKLIAGAVLPRGDYLIRVADDHYKDQITSRRACFPFSFDVSIVYSGSNPMVLSVNPLASVPLVRGVDVVLTLRFSESPRGSIEDVVSQISFAGVQATTGGSVQNFQSRYASASRTKTVVQTSVSEGQKVWVLAWSSQVLAQKSMTFAQLQIGPIRGNVSGQIFKFKPLTYSIVDAPKGAPWSGGSVSSEIGEHNVQVSQAKSEGEVSIESGSPISTPDRPDVRATQDDDEAEVHVEGGGLVAESQVGVVGGAVSVGEEEGEVHTEGLPSRPLPASSVVASVPGTELQESDLPKVEIWDPTGGATTSLKGKQDGSVTGHQMVVLLSLAAVAGAGILLMFPQLRSPHGRVPRRTMDFRSGDMPLEEEIGLVSARGIGFRDDDIL